MDLEEFIAKRPSFALQPNLYIILQDAGIKQSDGTFVPNNKFRCGTSGTTMFANADLPYRSGDSTTTGLISRCQLYMGFFRPFAGKIFAALRVKQALIAELDRDRTATDSLGNIYNVDRGGNTLSRVREREFHMELDQRKLRYQTGRELFETNNVNELISAMRTIRGEQMHLFTKDTIIEDPNYRGGSRREKVVITETTPRQQPERTSRAPSLTITLSKASLEQLRSGNPLMFERLLNLVKAFDDDKKNTTTVRVTRKDTDEIREETDRGRQLLDAVLNQTPLRRSPRFVDDATTETTLTETPALRRSSRLAKQQQQK